MDGEHSHIEPNWYDDQTEESSKEVLEPEALRQNNGEIPNTNEDDRKEFLPVSPSSGRLAEPRAEGQSGSQPTQW
jgi:hypothetical protein